MRTRAIIARMTYEHGTTEKRLPSWLRRPLARPGAFAQVDVMLHELGLHTVCQSAKCPNRGECFSEGTATFLVLGDACTRGCRFCAVETRRPQAPDPGEPARVGEVEAIRAAAPGAAIEVLVSDFGGDLAAVDAVVDARPDVFNHNVETVPRLYETVRPGAEYARSLGVLAHGAKRQPGIPVKSGLMLGLGETSEEVEQVMRDLIEAGCAMLTLGQYLRPSATHLPVTEFVPPARFAALARTAYSLGFTSVASAPFVRSSYHAAEQVDAGAS